jgi:hypothetical protein
LKLSNQKIIKFSQLAKKEHEMITQWKTEFAKDNNRKAVQADIQQFPDILESYN